MKKNIKNIIYNKTAKKTISKEYKRCTGIFYKIKGLMFTLSMKRALLFIFNKERMISLHMFFVFYPIDVLWLSKSKKVIYMKGDFRPFSICFPTKKAMYVLELPHKTIKKTHTHIGDKIEF